MRPTSRLLQHALRLTLFTHENCSLCVDVKEVMARVWDRRPFNYSEVDIHAPENQKWRSLYEFDIPVVRALLRKCSRSYLSLQPGPHRQNSCTVLQRGRYYCSGSQVEASLHRSRARESHGRGREGMILLRLASSELDKQLRGRGRDCRSPLRETDPVDTFAS